MKRSKNMIQIEDCSTVIQVYPHYDGVMVKRYIETCDDDENVNKLEEYGSLYIDKDSINDLLKAIKTLCPKTKIKKPRKKK
jgi:hypothetical protein